jgi:hypothetical protein
MRPRLSVTSVPKVIGRNNVSSKLTGEPGSWQSGTSFSYQWLRDGEPISGATSPNYSLTLDDYLHQIQVKVEGSLPGFSSVTRTSEPVDVIISSLSDLVSGSTCPSATFDQSNWSSISATSPRISGSPQVFKTLSSNVGAWAKGTKFCRLWVQNGKVVNNLLSDGRYHVISKDIGQRLQLIVVGTDRKGFSSFRFSQPVAVKSLTFVSAKLPVVSGSIKVGAKVFARMKFWSNGVDYSYQWLRNGVPIESATSKDYKLTQADSQTSLSLQVCGHKQNYEDLCLVSDSKQVN